MKNLLACINSSVPFTTNMPSFHFAWWVKKKAEGVGRGGVVKARSLSFRVSPRRAIILQTSRKGGHRCIAALFLRGIAHGEEGGGSGGMNSWR